MKKKLQQLYCEYDWENVFSVVFFLVELRIVAGCNISGLSIWLTTIPNNAILLRSIIEGKREGSLARYFGIWANITCALCWNAPTPEVHLFAFRLVLLLTFVLAVNYKKCDAKTKE